MTQTSSTITTDDAYTSYHAESAFLNPWHPRVRGGAPSTIAGEFHADADIDEIDAAAANMRDGDAEASDG